MILFSFNFNLLGSKFIQTKIQLYNRTSHPYKNCHIYVQVVQKIYYNQNNWTSLHVCWIRKDFLSRIKNIKIFLCDLSVTHLIRFGDRKRLKSLELNMHSTSVAGCYHTMRIRQRHFYEIRIPDIKSKFKNKDKKIKLMN